MLTFQQIDVLDTLQNNRHIFKVFGRTGDQSVLLNISGFCPYLYIATPPGFASNHLVPLQKSLATALIEGGKHPDPLIGVELVDRQSIYGYHTTTSFLKITLAVQPLMQVCKRALARGLNVEDIGLFCCDSYFESNIPLVLRFMIDTGMVGCCWLSVDDPQPAPSTSTCTLEYSCDYQQLKISLDSDIAPLRILSFDIECAGRKGIFPDPQVDPVIQIANIVTVQGQSSPMISNIFTLNTCAHIAGSVVNECKTEQELLMGWSDFVREVDPDIIIGYNINGFDFPYLLDRAQKLNLNKFPYLGRLKDVKTLAKDTRFSSKAHGTRDSKVVNIEGRVQLDLLQIMQRDYKLRSYTLNSVSAHFLGEQKEDVHHSIITDLQNGNDETRRRLLDKLMCVINYIEMARVTGVPINYLLTRGQQIKVVSQLYRKAADHNLLIPEMQVQGTDEQYEGATVIEPEKGFYQVPIATLDFTSLYPSIMMAHNMCYSTYLQDKSHADRYGFVQDKDYQKTPNGDMFLFPTVRKGLLPIILEDLISARKKAKQDLKKETDPFKRAVLDGRQLALKISANSVYGFTGATIGKLPLLAISSSVTAYGREMIEQTKSLVEEKYTTANGYEHDAKVIYGDTDSVMVKFGPPTVQECMDLGKEAAAFVTLTFKKPINLDFEKVYFPYLLINKKRYAGLYWTRPDKHDKLDAKGIETVRRDSCRLVSQVIETSLYKLLIDRDVEGAQKYVKDVISQLLQNKVDLSLLVISKGLGKAEYAGKQAHNELAIRMRQRDAGSAPAIGDRVSYVIIKGTKSQAAYEKAEDPIYVLDNNIPIDTKYYLENQLSKPLLRIFEPVLGEKAGSLLSGEHTRTVTVTAPTNGGLMRFAVKTAQCLECKVPVKHGRPTCDNCSHTLPQHYDKLQTQLAKNEVKFARLWTQCQNCQGSLHQDVLCTSQDCPIFYMRKKIQKELGDATQTIERFDYDW